MAVMTMRTTFAILLLASAAQGLGYAAPDGAGDLIYTMSSPPFSGTIIVPPAAGGGGLAPSFESDRTLLCNADRTSLLWSPDWDSGMTATVSPSQQIATVVHDFAPHITDRYRLTMTNAQYRLDGAQNGQAILILINRARGVLTFPNSTPLHDAPLTVCLWTAPQV